MNEHAANVEELAQEYGPMRKMSGYDECVAGVVERYGECPIFCYDYDKLMARLMADGMTDEEADEFFRYNQLGWWVGETTPCFIHLTEVSP